MEGVGKGIHNSSGIERTGAASEKHDILIDPECQACTFWSYLYIN